MAAADGPDFLCVGAQKGGTRWLYDQLEQHPDFWMPPVKELHYFDRRGTRSRIAERLAEKASASLERLNRVRARGHRRPLDERDLAFLDAYRAARGRDLDAYARLFAYKGERLAGDITPDYCKLGEPAIARIVARFPRARIVFIARDPVERVWSQLVMHVRKGDLVELTPVVVEGLLAKDFVASRSYQTAIVSRWKTAARDNFRLFLLDDLAVDPGRFRAQIIGFLGGDPDKPSGSLPPAYNRKTGQAKPAMTEAIRAALVDRFADELKVAAAVFGGAAADWPRKYGL